MARMSKPFRKTPVIALALFALVGLLVSEAVLAAPNAWPAKKGELCWDVNSSGEHSMVIAQITNMGSGHYLFHGQAYRINGVIGPLQPFSGNAEIDATDPADVRVIGMLSKTEIHANGNEMETFMGRFNLDYDDLGGTAVGITHVCDISVGVGNVTTCALINAGPVSMTLVDCP